VPGDIGRVVGIDGTEWIREFRLREKELLANMAKRSREYTEIF
jgi:hypothetical protein